MAILKKILLYTMHEDEHAEASQLQNARHTPGFSIGYADDHLLQLWHERGMVYQVLDERKPKLERPTVKSIELARRRNRETMMESLDDTQMFDLNASDPRAITQGVEFPAYFIIQLNTPLLPDDRRTLENMGIEILQYIPEQSYLIRLNQNVVDQLRSVPSITEIKYYSAFDTGIEEFSTRSPATELTPMGTELVTFDVAVHRQEDLQALIEIIRAAQAQIVGASKKKVRISVERQSPFLTELSHHEIVRKIEEFIPPKLQNDLSRTWLALKRKTARSLRILLRQVRTRSSELPIQELTITIRT